MNIVRIGNSNLVIDCKNCGQEVAHPYASLIILDEYLIATPACPTLGCTRSATYIPRQRPTDDPAEWAWDHNRAMNYAFQVALKNGAQLLSTLLSDIATKLTNERAIAATQRFTDEAWKVFGPTDRVKSVAAEMTEEAAE